MFSHEGAELLFKVCRDQSRRGCFDGAALYSLIGPSGSLTKKVYRAPIFNRCDLLRFTRTSISNLILSVPSFLSLFFFVRGRSLITAPRICNGSMGWHCVERVVEYRFAISIEPHWRRRIRVFWIRFSRVEFPIFLMIRARMDRVGANERASLAIQVDLGCYYF